MYRHVVLCLVAWLSTFDIASASATFSYGDGTPETFTPSQVILHVACGASNLPAIVDDRLFEPVVVAQTTRALQLTGNPLQPFQALAWNYGPVCFRGLPTCIYADRTTEICSMPITWDHIRALPPRNIVDTAANPAFIDRGQWLFLDDPIRPGQSCFATYCLIRHRLGWKLHCWYISRQPVDKAQKMAMIHQLTLTSR